MAQNKSNPLVLYSLVVNYLLYVFILTIGGFLLGKYVVFKTIIAAGILATVGAIIGIILFISGMIKIGRETEHGKE